MSKKLKIAVIGTGGIAQKCHLPAYENIDNVEYVVASEPMMTSQAYSLMLVKVKASADANSIA